MTELLALSVSVAVLGGIWAFIALGPLGGFALATANTKLTFRPDHSVGADDWSVPETQRCLPRRWLPLQQRSQRVTLVE